MTTRWVRDSEEFEDVAAIKQQLHSQQQQQQQQRQQVSRTSTCQSQQSSVTRLLSAAPGQAQLHRALSFTLGPVISLAARVTTAVVPRSLSLPMQLPYSLASALKLQRQMAPAMVAALPEVEETLEVKMLSGVDVRHRVVSGVSGFLGVGRTCEFHACACGSFMHRATKNWHL